MTHDDFFAALAERKKWVYDFLHDERYAAQFSPDHIRDAVYGYLRAGGKSLRPAVLLFSCGAVGGDEKAAIPVAAAVEISHTWTLVHDDIIDRDALRRGVPTVHEAFRRRAEDELGYGANEAAHYGLSIAILAGDMQQGWAVSMLTELADRSPVDPRLALFLIREIEMGVLSKLIAGEMNDVRYSKVEIPDLSETQIVKMLTEKTGVLYEFSGRAGAMVGLNTTDPNHPQVKAIATFASKCGTAFQLQDDILGIVGDESTLGKPVGSDIREGKRTVIVLRAYQNGNERQRNLLLNTLGNANATDGDTHQATQLLRDLGGIEYTERLARSFITEALEELDVVPASPYKDLLKFWADYMIERAF